MAKRKDVLTGAERNAREWLETIRQHVACMDADRKRLQELRDKRDALEGDEERNWPHAQELADLEASVTIEGDELDEDAIRERIQESPLSVQVRYGWIDPGDTAAMLKDGPDEYCILLSTGGPALRIVGDLGRGNCPESARLQHQEWGTLWTELHGMTSEDDTALIRWVEQLDFGE